MSVTTVCRDISALTENAQKACRLFLAECKRQGLNVLITETYRSQERQNYLYAQGRTRPGKCVTWTKSSRHISHRAWDICKNVKGQEYSDTDFFKRCGEIAKELNITWGGTWSTPDMPHFEISKDWTYDDMENERKVYRYGTEVPDWGKSALYKAQLKGVFMGASEDNLDLSEDCLKMLVYLDRLHLLD